MGSEFKYAALKNIPGVTKTLKFKQSRLMRNAIGDDALLTSLIVMFKHYGVDAATRMKYLTEIGACSVFSARWLSEVLGVPYENQLRDATGSPGQSSAVAQSMMRNYFTKEKSRDALAALLRLHGLKSNGPKLVYMPEQFPLITMRAGSFLVGCFGMDDTAHGIALMNDGGGMFFDPNVGEYSLSATTRETKKNFIKTWLQICRDDLSDYRLFWAYPVARA